MQAMKMLQETSLELEQQLKQEMEHNPALEVKSNMEILAGNPMEDTISKGEYEDDRAAEVVAHDENLMDAARENLAGDTALDENSISTWTPDDEEKRRLFLSSLSTQESPQEMLLDQIKDVVQDEDSPLFDACREVLGNLDDNGYLTASNDEIANGAGVDAETAEKAVHIIQSFTPDGIGGRNLREVLLLQLEHKREKGSLAWDIVDKYLEDLGRNRLQLIANALYAEVAEIQEAADRIKQLNPKPGLALASSTAPIVIPEVEILRNNDGKLVARLTKGTTPEVSIAPDYEKMQSDKSISKDARAEITDYINAVKQIMKSLEFRKSTIERIADALIFLQADFFEKGKTALKPLVMATVADILELHETTISRAIANKYVRTPFGLFPLKYFFRPGYDNAEGDSVSSTVVKFKIKELVRREDKTKPLSDNKIAEILSKDGIEIARRTIAKYREEDGIPAASLRKTHI